MTYVPASIYDRKWTPDFLTLSRIYDVFWNLISKAEMGRFRQSQSAKAGTNPYETVGNRPVKEYTGRFYNLNFWAERFLNNRPASFE